jgi:hypothetical protein
MAQPLFLIPKHLSLPSSPIKDLAYVKVLRDAETFPTAALGRAALPAVPLMAGSF